MFAPKFSPGDRVRLVPNLHDMIRLHPNQMSITYEVVRVVPEERDGQPQYHIKSEVEPHMRSVPENQLSQI